MRKLTSYRGKKPGDVVKVNVSAYPNKKLAKVVAIYKTSRNVRFHVKLAGGIDVDIHEQYVEFEEGRKPCNCSIETLMRAGCLCGGV